MEHRRIKKPRMSPEPSSTAGHRLPPEIVLYEILPWLPVRRLLKFRRVCRDWHHFISVGNHRLAIQQFQRNIHRHPDTSIGGIYGFYRDDQNKSIYRSFFDNTLTVLCPSIHLNVKARVAFTNGLGCLLCIHNMENSNNASPFAYIFNPFMKKIGERVPLIHGGHDSSFVPFFRKTGITTRTLGLAFDPMASIHDDDYIYRLVQFDWICSDNRPEVPNVLKWEVRFLVYSSNSKNWVKSKYRMPSIVVDTSCMLIWPAFYAGGGKIYWHSSSFLVQYDLERDVASCMAMPELPTGDADDARVRFQELNVVRGGRLICMRLLWSSYLEVWALDEKQWVCMEKVDSNAIVDMGLRMERLIGLKDNTNFRWWHKGACIYEDEEDGRRRMYLKYYFSCTDKCTNFVGALDYDLEKKRVVRRHVKGRLIRKILPSRSWMMWVFGPVFTIHHTMLGVPT